MGRNNLLLLADAYKYSHFNQYPVNTIGLYSYLESRGGLYDETVFFGLQYYIREYLSKPFTLEDIQDAKRTLDFMGVAFPEDKWKAILDKHNGYLPLDIRAVKEGTVVPTGHPLMSIQNTDPDFPWLTGFIETLLLKVWYPCNVATRSREFAKVIKPFWDQSSDNPSSYTFSLHNFGDRGSSSVESAAIGGMAHLTAFDGTDNTNAVRKLEDYYGLMKGHSIPASEHSTVTSWGKLKETDMIRHYLEEYKDSPLVACVLDSYDIYKAVDEITSGDFLRDIESKDDKYPMLVIRPDSGDPIEVIGRILTIMEENGVGVTINKKGYDVFDKYRIIWGDGINEDTVKEILEVAILQGYSAENFAFGCGGYLMQDHDRGTSKYAIKMSEGSFALEGSRPIFKDPITDPGKRSKKGRVITVMDLNSGDLSVSTRDTYDRNKEYNLLQSVSLNPDQDIEEIRKRCKI